jgi:uncharacterized protein (TIGR02001 family)
LRRALALWFALAAADVAAQVSGSVTLVSDYRFRGVSLSHHRPAAQVAATYDDAEGWYGGVFASTVQLAEPSDRQLQGTAFGGYVWRLSSVMTSEAGADYSAFSGGHGYSYPEVYLGVALENLSARLYYAPRYFAQKSDTLYGEVNVSQPLFDRVRLLAHAGALRARNERAYIGRGDNPVFDARVGVGIDFDQFSIQVSWVGISSSSTPYPVTGMSGRNGAVASLFLSF